MKEFKEDIAILLWSLRRYCKDIAKPNFKTLVTFNTLYDFAPCNVWMNLSRDDFFCGEIKWGYPFSEDLGYDHADLREDPDWEDHHPRGGA